MGVRRGWSRRINNMVRIGNRMGGICKFEDKDKVGDNENLY
jgi:hypothetical protein